MKMKRTTTKIISTIAFTMFFGACGNLDQGIGEAVSKLGDYQNEADELFQLVTNDNEQATEEEVIEQIAEVANDKWEQKKRSRKPLPKARLLRLVRMIIKKADQNEDKTVTLEEIKEIKEQAANQLRIWVNKVDENQDQEITKEELRAFINGVKKPIRNKRNEGQSQPKKVGAMSKKRADLQNVDQIIFRRLDMNQDQVITMKEVEGAVKVLKQRFTKLIKRMDQNNDQQLTMKELKKAVKIIKGKRQAFKKQLGEKQMNRKDLMKQVRPFLKNFDEDQNGSLSKEEKKVAFQVDRIALRNQADIIEDEEVESLEF